MYCAHGIPVRTYAYNTYVYDAKNDDITQI